MGVLRTWHCQNVRCGHQFDAWEANPACPTCGCVRVGWIPGGGHVGCYSKGADVELRALADIFKLDNMNSAERGQAAKQVRTPGRYRDQRVMHTFPGGFTAGIDPSQGAQCVPAINKIDFKVKAAPGRALPRNENFALPTPVIEARHKP